MLAYAAIPLTCWLCALLAAPRKPLPGNAMQELIYSRLLGRQEGLHVLAILVTAVALIVAVLSLPQRPDTDLYTIRQARAACIEAQHAASDAADYGVIIRVRCYALQPGGEWAEGLEKSDGSWLIVGTLPSPPVFARPALATAKRRFLERNTTDLPGAVPATIRPVDTSGQGRI